MDSSFRLHNGIRKGLGILPGQTENMERQALRCLTANAGQPGKLIRQILQCSGKKTA